MNLEIYFTRFMEKIHFLNINQFQFNVIFISYSTDVNLCTQSRIYH